MKRRLLSILIVLFASCSLFSANLQKTYNMTDEIWIKANRLSRTAGRLGPEPVSPTTGAAILQALERLDYCSLTQKEKNIYDEIKEELTADPNLHFNSKYIDLNLEVYLNPEFYYFNNTKDTYYYEFFKNYNKQPSFASIKGEASFGDMLYMYLGYTLKDAPFYFGYNDNGDVTRGELFYRFTNFAFILHPDPSGKWYFINKWENGRGYLFINNYRPILFGTSIGNEYMNLFLGQAPHSLGSGKIGNMTISDSFQFQHVALFSVFTGIVSYNLSITSFDNFEKMLPYNGSLGTSSTSNNSLTLNGDHQIRSISRFAFNLFNRARLTIETGALMVTNSFDWRIFLPIAIPHNWGNNKENMILTQADEANNILTIALDYTPIKNLSFNLQLTSDQFMVYGESGGGRPNALGLLFNTTYTFDLKDWGYMDLWGEFYYSTPYLYLNTKYTVDWDRINLDSEEGTLSQSQVTQIEAYAEKDDWASLAEYFPQYLIKNYRYDWIVGYGYDRNSASDFNYSGYPYGPDTIAGAIGLEWDSYKEWKAGLNIIYKVHGSKGYQYATNSNQNMDNTNGENMNATTPTGIPEHTFQFIIESEYKLNKHLEFTASLSNSSIWNYHNEKGAFKDYIQTAIGMKWTIF